MIIKTQKKKKFSKIWASLSDDVEYATVFKTGEFDYEVVVKELIEKIWNVNNRSFMLLFIILSLNSNS